jgi:putative exosortase-associated protein (TIGR04073 family)
MRKFLSLAVGIGGIALLATGCAGPEQKFGRGLNNATEFARLGEIRRSMEQTAIWDGTDKGYTLGFFRGVNRSLARTGVGLFEMLTFPIPTPDYEPIFYPIDPVYPDASKPRFLADPSWTPDSFVGFNGGDVAPFVPGSKFRVYDY